MVLSHWSKTRMATIFVTWKNMQLQHNCIEFVTVDPEVATQWLSMKKPSTSCVLLLLQRLPRQSHLCHFVIKSSSYSNCVAISGGNYDVLSTLNVTSYCEFLQNMSFNRRQQICNFADLVSHVITHRLHVIVNLTTFIHKLKAG